MSAGGDPLSDDDLAGILDELAVAAPELAVAKPAPAPAAAENASFFTIEEEVPTFVFGQDAARAPERLATFERVSEKLARAIKDVVEPFARTRVHVTAPAPEFQPYGAWAAALPAFISLSHYRLRPHKGGMLLAVEAELVAALVESFYGGATDGARARRGGDFTTSEELLLRRLIDRIVAAMTALWADYAPVEPQLAQRETNAGYLTFVRAEEAMAVQRFQLSWMGQTATVQMLFPLAMLRPIEARLASKVHDEGDGGGANDAWRLKLAGALSQVSLPVRSVLARPEISVAQLLALKPGDVIPITLPARTPLLAGSRIIADGVIGEQEGRAALMIEQVGNRLT